METVIAAFALPSGLALGSFLNVVAARLPLRQSIVSPGSSCPACSAPIALYDNVPLLSFLLLRGRCRSCGVSIAWKYPAVEAVTGLLVSGCFLRFGLSGEAAVGALFCCALVAVSVTDLERRVIPNRIVLPVAAVVLPAQTVLQPSPEWAIAAFGSALFFLLAAVAYPGGMGMGDVKLALLVGAAVGRNAPIALMIAMLGALVPSLVILLRHGSAGRKMGIPFGPFLAFGGVVALFAGQPLLDAYLNSY
jgi:leader peptidase (prepilin peptidase) / N-methyltransferase